MFKFYFKKDPENIYEMLYMSHITEVEESFLYSVISREVKTNRIVPMLINFYNQNLIYVEEKYKIKG